MNRLLILFVALFTLPLVCAPPAQAKWNGGSIRHASDNGWNSAFVVKCHGDRANRYRGVREGQHSDNVCPSQDVDRVYVRTNEEIWCEAWAGTYDKKWDATGWHEIGNLQNFKCVVHRD